jgi:hypothetical protein
MMQLITDKVAASIGGNPRMLIVPDVGSGILLFFIGDRRRPSTSGRTVTFL